MLVTLSDYKVDLIVLQYREHITVDISGVDIQYKIVKVLYCEQGPLTTFNITSI